MNLLLWVCAAPEPFEIDALRELLAMDLETGQVRTERMSTEAYLLQSGVGLVTVEIANKVIIPVHSTARKFVFSQSARRQFESMSKEVDAKESWPLCIKAALWSESTFRSALGSLCLSQIELGTSLEVATRLKPVKMRMPQPEIPKFLRSLMSLNGGQRAAEISIMPTSSKRQSRQTSAKVSLRYAIDNWLTCNKIIATEGVAFPWMTHIYHRTSLQTTEQLFEKVAKGRNDSFGVHPWPAVSGSLNSHMLNMFSYAVADDHVPLLQVVKRNRKSLPSDVFDRPLPKHGEMLAIHVATTKGFTDIINELIGFCDASKVCRSTGENVLHLAAKTGESGHFMTFLGLSTVNANLQDKDGRTPLHWAALEGNEAVVKAMLETARVEVNLTDGAGQTPLHWAAGRGKEAVVKAMLETARVEVNLKNGAGQTPLHLAAKNGKEALVKAMLQTARVEVNLTDRFGQTSRDLAAKAGYKKVAKLIR
jgi:translation initiation factor IF-1